MIEIDSYIFDRRTFGEVDIRSEGCQKVPFIEKKQSVVSGIEECGWLRWCELSIVRDSEA